ncbi:MAG: RusA family crossover junction endodeoxyribonuclease [Planctomycetota bacterium]
MNQPLAILSLPWPPSVNTYYRTIVVGGRGRTLLSQRGREYQAEADAAIGAVTTKLTQRLCVGLLLFAPDRRKRDLDNHSKAILDALEHAGVYENDEQIDRLIITRREIVKGGRADVVISAIGTEAAA